MGSRCSSRKARVLLAVAAGLLALGAQAPPALANGEETTAITLAPATATNTVGQQHCVTATVTNVSNGKAVDKATVQFTVTGANTASGKATTNKDGKAQFCYTGTKTGSDTITAFHDKDKDDTRDPGEPSATATKTWTAAAPSTITLSPTTATNTAGQQHCVTATAKDSFGNPTPGVIVRFSVAGANSASGSATTNASGQATFCYTGTKAGTDEITAFADTNGNGTKEASEPSATATKTYTAAAPASVTLSPATATNTAGQQHCVTATVKDQFGNPNSGVVVRFSVTGANSASGSATTNASGQGTFCYTGTKAGVDTITGFADTNGNGTQETGEPSGAATKTYTPAAPATLTLEPPVATNPAATEHCVTARVRDAFGNPTPGVTVVFSVTGANTASGSVATNSSGEAKFCYTGTKVGTDTITAFADANKNGSRDVGEPNGTAVKAYVPGQPASLTLEPSTATNTAGEPHCVTSTVKDIAGNPTPGIVVRFSVTGANSSSGTAVTDANGQATFCYTGTKAGNDTINAFADPNANGTQDAGEPSGTATKVYRAAAPAVLSLSPLAATNTVGQQHCVTATVTDQFGNPNAGISVAFSVAGVNAAGGSATTNAGGQATFCYTGTKAGADAITAFADTNGNGTQDFLPFEPSGAATKTYTPGEPATLTLAPPAAENPAGKEHCVTATVRDAFGNPTPNVSVVFSVSGANPTSAPVVKTTDASGQATFCYTGTKAGLDTITAFADTNKNGQQDTGEPGGTAAKLYVPAAPATLTLLPPTDTNAAGEEHCVTATVKDAFGNPTPGIVVVFTVSGANAEGGVKTTDASGQATFCYTGTKAGTDTITAFADTNKNGSQDLGEPSGMATKIYKPGPPASLTLAPQTATNEAGQQHCVTATVKDRFGNPTPGVVVKFSVSGANSAGGFKATDTSGEAQFCYTGTKAGTDTITAFADTNGNGTQDTGEPGDTATKIYKPGPPATLTLTPKAATNPVNTQHCVTAAVKDAFGNATPDIAVVFTVIGSVTASGTTTTNASGEAKFCYIGPKLVGADAIKAFADTNTNTVQDAGEPIDTAAKTWVAGPPASLVLTPPTATNTAGQEHCVTATVKDTFGNPTPGVTVVFSVSGANPQLPVPKTTDASGQATFCYTGTKAGTDTITAFADTNKNGSQDLGEPSGMATKIYKPGPPASLTLAPQTATNEAGQEHCVTATVKDQFGNPTPAIVVRFSVSGANSAGGFKATDTSGQAQFCYTGTKAGTDTITAFADTNGNGTQDTGEPGDTATKIYKPGPPASLTLAPKTATNPVDSQHCVTATVTDAFGNPNKGVSVVFTVIGSVTASGTTTTNASGEAKFCYIGPELPGEDVIKAFADANENASQDLGEPTGAATKTWVLPASTPGCEVKITNGGWFVAMNGDRASFGGNAKVDLDGNVTGQEEYQDHGPVEAMNLHGNVLVVICHSATEASVYGEATIDGSGSFFYRIRVVDNGEPGTNDKYGIIVGNGYTSGDQTLQGGNVQVHKS